MLSFVKKQKTNLGLSIDFKQLTPKALYK